MLERDDAWVWDFWTVDDPSSGPERFHLFYLHAPRSLGDPDLRHRNASVGHAVSADLRTWRPVGVALAPQPVPAFDDMATWTGSGVRMPDGTWAMFTTGIDHGGDGLVQRIGRQTSTDLTTWRRAPEPLLEADARWYARGGRRDGQEHWRDPFVIQDDRGTWHMYVTAQDPDGDGVVGHAVSPDLEHWEVGPPLSDPTGRFEQLEVISLHRVDGRWVLLFCCMSPEMPGAEPGTGGIWSIPVDGPGSRVDVTRARRVTSEDLYVGRLVDDADGTPWFLAFENRDADGEFVGRLIDPCRITWNSDHTALELLDGPDRWRPGASEVKTFAGGALPD